MELKFKRLNSRAELPRKAHATDAGLDLTVTSFSMDHKANTIQYGFGLAVEIPVGHVGLLFPRSSVYKTGLSLTNCVGVIDSGYRGEIKAVFVSYDRSHCDAYSIGERACQLIVMPIPDVETTWADELSDSDRGEGGYGSTGR